VGLIAATIYFQVPIYVYEYSSMSCEENGYVLSLLIKKKNSSANNTVEDFELYHTKDVHYDCIVSKDTGFLSTVTHLFDKTES